MSTEIVVRFQVAGFHQWPDAPDNRSYLRDKHRHLFHVEASMPVSHNEREVEFHDFLDFCRRRFPGGDLGARSCESMAEALAITIKNRYQRSARVAVFEDGEVGAVVYSPFAPSSAR